MAEEKQIGVYRVLKSLGSGGMGVVYLVEDQEAGGLFALKLLAPSITSSEREVRRFRREFMTMNRLRHSNIVKVYDSGVHDGSIYFVMEYVQGDDLQGHYLPRECPEEPVQDLAWLQMLNEPDRIAKVLRTTLQVCDALAFIHRHHIVHRDLKPDNILIAQSGAPKLLDFGIAKRLGSSEISQDNSIMGTFTYISPEQAQCTDVDGRSDLYTLGVILYELLAGRPPFLSAEPIGRLYMHLNKKPPSPRDFNPHLDPALEELILTLLRKDPIERFQRAEDLYAAIESYAQGRFGGGEASWQGGAMAFGAVAEPKFVGRDSEREALLRHGEKLREGKGGLVLLSGNTGMGKTRLAREFMSSMRVQKVECCTARCHPEAPPYAVYQELFEQLRASLAWREEALPERLWGEAGRTWFRLMESEPVSRTDSGEFDTMTPSSGGAEEEKFMLFEAARQMLERVLEEDALIFFLDDAMYADEISLELTEYLVNALAAAQAPHQLMILGAFRNEDVNARHPLNRLMADLSATDFFRLFDLKVLDDAAIDDMAESMLGAPLMSKARRSLIQQSQGIPFFVEELVKAWHEDEELRFDGEAWRLSKQAMVHDDEHAVVRQALPAAIRQRLERRLSRLPQEAQQLAAWISALGEEATFDWLVALGQWPEQELLTHLDALIQQKILVEDWGAGTERYRFSHPGFRETFYGRLEPERRLHIHHCIANALRQLAEMEGSYELIAHHYLEAHQDIQGVWFLLLAAEQQSRAYAHRSAGGLLQRCKPFLEQYTNEEAFRPASNWWWRYQLATLDVFEVMGKYQKGLQQASDALSLLPSSADATPLLCWKAIFSRHLGLYREGLECVKTALQNLPSEGDWRPYLLQEAGRIYRNQGMYNAALDSYREALTWAVSKDLLWEQGRLSGMIGQILHQRGALSEARAYDERALEIALHVEDRRGEAEAHCRLGALALDEGDTAQSWHHLELALSQTVEIGDRRVQCTAHRLMGRLQAERRLFDEAREQSDFAIRLAKELSDTRSESELLLAQGVLYYQDDVLRSARIVLEEAIDKAHIVGDRVVEFESRAWLCAVDTREDMRPLSSIVEELERLIRLSEQMGLMELILVCKLAFARVHRLSGQMQAALDALVEARYMALEIGHSRMLAHIERERHLLRSAVSVSATRAPRPAWRSAL